MNFGKRNKKMENFDRKILSIGKTEENILAGDWCVCFLALSFPTQDIETFYKLRASVFTPIFSCF